MITTFLMKFLMEFFKLKTFLISLDTSLSQRREIAGLITAELKLFSSANLNNLFRTPHVSLSAPGFQTFGRELKKTTELRRIWVLFTFKLEAMLFKINQSQYATSHCSKIRTPTGSFTENPKS